MSKSHSTKPPVPAIVNRRARFDYELSDDIVVGMNLTGLEVRAVREGHVQLKGAYVTIRNSELWLNNASFSLRHNEQGQPNARKLLAKRRQIEQLAARKKDGYTIVPTKLLTSGRYIKLVIALGKGKKRYDKRETIKRRDVEREQRRAVRRYR